MIVIKVKTDKMLPYLYSKKIHKMSDIENKDIESPRKLSELIEDTIEEFGKREEDTIEFRDIIAAFHERGFGMLLLILASPMALPLPVPPGVNVLMASPLMLLTSQQLYGAKSPWLPETLLKRQIKREMFEKTMRMILPWIQKIEYMTKARLGFITHGIFSHLIGLCGLLMALSVCVPLPLTNSVPSLGIALMSVGVLMRDGLAVITGMVIGLSWITMLIFVGDAGLKFIMNTFGFGG